MRNLWSKRATSGPNVQLAVKTRRTRDDGSITRNKRSKATKRPEPAAAGPAEGVAVNPAAGRAAVGRPAGRADPRKRRTRARDWARPSDRDQRRDQQNQHRDQQAVKGP